MSGFLGEWPPQLAVPSGEDAAFDAYLIADWSANGKPKTGPDSIWWVCVRWEEGRLVVERVRNPSTRVAAAAEIRSRLLSLVGEGRSVLVGFDFPYGYPAGFAARLGLPAKAPWRAMWKALSERIVDRQGQGGTNNRFEVAASLNLEAGGPGPFWGHPHGRQYEGLTAKKPPLPWCVPEFRAVERRARGAKSAFQLNGAGSVGGQVLMGLPILEALRSDPRLEEISAVWPFETGPALPQRGAGPRVVHAEIYPSLVEHPVPDGWVKDEAQVVALAHHLAAKDAAGELAAYFEAASAGSDSERRQVMEEEGWILGVPS